MSEDASKRVVSRSQIHELWKWLAEQGYQVVGPCVHEGAIVYDEISSPRNFRLVGRTSSRRDVTV